MTVDKFINYLNNVHVPVKSNIVIPDTLLQLSVESYNPFLAHMKEFEIPKVLPKIDIKSDMTESELASKYVKSNRVKDSQIKGELGEDFLKKVKEVAKRLNCNYKDLIGLMNSESSLNPKARNKKSKATGLIQFMPSTARELGTSVDELMKMSAIEQLDYVEKYLSRAKSFRFGKNEKLDAGELYALTYLPGRANRNILAQSGEKYYRWNKGLDLNGDGKITKDELAQRIQNKQVSDMYFA